MIQKSKYIFPHAVKELNTLRHQRSINNNNGPDRKSRTQNRLTIARLNFNILTQTHRTSINYRVRVARKRKRYLFLVLSFSLRQPHKHL